MDAGQAERHAALFGPVFRPAERGPCWSCLAYRLRGHQEVHNFLRNLASDNAAFVPCAAEPAVLDAVYGLVSAEIAKWLVFGNLAPIHERGISLDVGRLKSEHNSTMRRPQCLACGDEALHRPDRAPVPVRLRPSSKGVRNSGGFRSVTPEETLARYRHLVSPVSGVVTWLMRTTDETDPWLHVYWAGSNVALRGANLSSLRRSLRSKSAGKGSTPRQSEASALCEAIERYSSAFHGDEIRRRRRYVDFVRAGESQAIHPNDIQLFSEWQLDNAEQVNARGHPYNMVPARLDPDAEIDWSPVWSLTQGRHRYLPMSMLYGMAPEQRGRSDFAADSNGCAAGNTLEEAIFQGFLELVERDAFAIWWYNRLRVPGVDLESFGDEYLAATADHYRRFRRESWVLDVTADLGIPAFVAVSRRTDKDAEDIIYGAGAHTDPHIAALRAVCEMNQCLNWVQGTDAGGAGHAVDDPLCLWWWKNAKLADHPYLAPAPGERPRGKADYPVPDTADVREDVESCRALVEARGMEFLVLDQTRPISACRWSESSCRGSATSGSASLRAVCSTYRSRWDGAGTLSPRRSSTPPRSSPERKPCPSPHRQPGASTRSLPHDSPRRNAPGMRRHEHGELLDRHGGTPTARSALSRGAAGAAQRPRLSRADRRSGMGTRGGSRPRPARDHSRLPVRVRAAAA